MTLVKDPSGRCRRTGGGGWRSAGPGTGRRCRRPRRGSPRRRSPRSISTSIVSSSRCSSCRPSPARWWQCCRRRAPSRARVPGLDQGHQLDDRVAGHAVGRRSSCPSQPRFAGVSGTLTDLQPSNDTVRYPPDMTPGVRGWPSGPASTSNSAPAGATPIRRRRSRSAFADGAARPSAVQRRGQLPPDAQVARAAGTGTSRAGSTPRSGTAAAATAAPGRPLLQHRVNQLERHDPGQLAQVTRGKNPRGDRDRRGNRRDGRADGRLNAQRRSPVHGAFWSTPVLPGLRCHVRRKPQSTQTA